MMAASTPAHTRRLSSQAMMTRPMVISPLATRSFIITW